jgi:nitrile hydratase
MPHSNDDHCGHHHDATDDAVRRVSPFVHRVAAIETALLAKGMLTADRIEAMRLRRAALSPATGAKLVARAWINPRFRDRLLASPASAAAELGIEFPPSFRLVVVENTPALRNLVVCTLCSCYPVPLLGRPPDWYKSLNYRRRAVRDPRWILSEFGVAVAADCRVVVHDSTADLRYLVLPQRPVGTEDWSEEKLAAIVTRDSMIGAGDPVSPPG